MLFAFGNLWEFLVGNLDNWRVSHPPLDLFLSFHVCSEIMAFYGEVHIHYRLCCCPPAYGFAN